MAAPRAYSTPRPSPKPLPSDLIVFMCFVVNELQQEPRDVSQDKGGDEVPVNHVPQTANASVEGPGQGSAGVRSQLALGQPGVTAQLGWVRVQLGLRLSEARQGLGLGEAGLHQASTEPWRLRWGLRASSGVASCMAARGQCPGASPKLPVSAGSGPEEWR